MSVRSGDSSTATANVEQKRSNSTSPSARSSFSITRNQLIDNMSQQVGVALFMSGPLRVFLAFLAAKSVWMDFSLTRRKSGYFFIFIFLHRRRNYYSVWNGGLCRCR